MNKNKLLYFLKTKILTKQVAFGAFGLAITAGLAGTIGYKYSHPFKPSFFNYKQYMLEENQDIIRKYFDYKEFDTLNQFTNAILTNKAVAGIGSDAQAVNLIKKNKLKKINFHKLFPNVISESDLENKDILAQKLQELYTEQVWQHLSSYDKELEVDENGKEFSDGKRHLWEYFTPYFSQDMVVAYNPSKVLNIKNDENLNFKKYYDLDKQILNDLITTNEDNENDNSWEAGSFSLYSILKTLKKYGFNNLEATDAVRDNMIYGSGYRFDKESNKYVDSYATGKGNDFDNGIKDHKELINQFADLIKNSTGYSLNSPKINFIGDGLELVDRIVNPASDIQFGIIYNGDAFDAYKGADNVNNSHDGAIRYIKPKTNLLLIDGLVIVDGIDKEFEDKVYEVVKNSFLEGLGDGQWEDSGVDKTELHSYLNFDNVGYTPAFKKLVDFIEENDFEYIENWSKPSTMTDVSDDEWEDMKKYEQQYASNLFAINAKYNLKVPGTLQDLITSGDKTYTVNHYDIKPVDEKTLTEIETYWNLKIKK
ncbi:hypothetical protein [Mycoplasmopsis columbina]|uniref:hypothetical protein n=1 Tax=Mycoplasmopsis columbina TaxID=114881 RepID=UPI00068A1478|nr:hypothetical protein [Mycoplasmopsis columbina]VEU76814.1 Uncharacterised protein [Mycoplasmopsis columbina]